MEELLGRALPCLDAGFVRVVDYLGDDASIASAARVSYGGGTRRARPDRDLIRYLMRHRHTSPFEMCEVKVHVKLPIFVARQWIRHRTASVNEVSGRYSVLDQASWLPEPEALSRQSQDNRQGRAAAIPTEEAEEILEVLRHGAARSWEDYGHLLEHHDLARELARVNLPLSTYTQWVWKIDLHNLFHFLALRLHPHAQQEIRAYAHLLADIVRAWVPVAWEAFEDYQLEARTFSRQELALLRQRLAGFEVLQEESGLSRREWDEFNAALDGEAAHSQR
jgi:thymidylate synthase (FAD)